MSDSMQRRVALVTGAGGGIGRATVTALARDGADIAALDLDADAAAQAAALADHEGLTGLALVVDVASVDEIEAAVTKTVEHFGRIDILVNNAGSGTQEQLFDVTEAAWDRVIAVNLRACFFLMQAVGRRFVQQGTGGNIVSVSSAAGFRAIMTHPVYSASKAGVDALTRSFAASLGAHGVNVNAVAPGLTATRMAGRLGDAEAQQRAVESGPLENLLRRVSAPEDVANVIAFLCSPASRQMTGQTLHTSAGNVV